MKSHWPISILSTLSALINMLMPLVLVRVLGPDEIGAFKIFFLYLMMFPAFSFTSGVINGLSYWAGRDREGRTCIQVSGQLVLGSGLLFMLAGLGFREQIAAHLGWSYGQTTIFAAALFGAITSTFYEEAAIATGKIWKGAIFSSGFELIRTVAILAAAIATHRLMPVFVAHVVIQLIKTVLSTSIAQAQGLLVFSWNRDALRSVWRYAFPVSLAWMFGVFVNYADQFLLSNYISAADFAFYAVGCLSVPPLTILEYSITRILIPDMSAAFSRKEPSRAAELYRKAVEEMGFLMIPAVAGMVVFAQPIIRLLFTDRYLAAAEYLRPYALGYLILIIPYDSIPRARGQARWILGNFVSFSILSLVGCYFLIKGFGSFGALAGSLFARAAMRIYAVFYIRGSTGWKFGEFLPLPELARFTAVATALALPCLFLRSYFPGADMKWFLVCGVAFSILYFLVLGLWSRARFLKQSQEHRVLQLTQYLGLGGLERMILNLSTVLRDELAWEPEIFVFDHPMGAPAESHLTPSFQAAKLPVHLHFKRIGFSPKTALLVARKVHSMGASVIHTHDLGALIYGSCAKLLTFNRVRIVHTQHSFVHLGRKRRYQLYEKFFTRFADEIAVVSPDTRDTYLNLGLPPDKIHVIPNGVQFAIPPAGGRALRIAERSLVLQSVEPGYRDAAQALGGPGSVDSIWILYLARLHGRKGQDHAMAVWGSLSPDIRKRVSLCFVGLETERGQLDRLNILRKAAPDRERIHYLGPSQYPHPWLACSDVALSCSEFEGMPLVPIEAFGSGLPLLLSDIPGHAVLRDLTRHYPLSNPEAGARELEILCRDVLGDPEHIHKRLWEQAAPVRERFSMERMGAQYEKLYIRPGQETVNK